MWTLQRSQAFSLPWSRVKSDARNTEKERGKVVSDRETDKLPDIMGPILPP